MNLVAPYTTAEIFHAHAATPLSMSSMWAQPYLETLSSEEKRGVC